MVSSVSPLPVANVAFRKLALAAAICWRDARSRRRLASKPALWFKVAVVEVEQSGQAYLPLALVPQMLVSWENTCGGKTTTTMIRSRHQRGKAMGLQLL